MRVTLKPGAWVDPKKMLAAIHAAGFTPAPEDVHLTVSGTIEIRAGRFVVVLDGMKEPKALACLPGESGDALRRAGKAGAGVRIHGRWLLDVESLQVESVENG